MQPASLAAPRARSHYRHELQTLTYVTLFEASVDHANGQEANVGVMRNLNHRGAQIRLVAPVRPQQRLRLRFELKSPRVRVETHVEVTWTGSSGQCGVCFVDLPARTCHEINEWIFANLLDKAARQPDQEDGLILSAPARPAIQLEPGAPRLEPRHVPHQSRVDRPTIDRPTVDQPTLVRPTLDQPYEDWRQKRSPGAGISPVRGLPVGSSPTSVAALPASKTRVQTDWLSQPLSGRTLAWLVDSLVMIAALLFFALIFVAIAHELPPWPLTLALVLGAAVFVGLAYWILFEFCGGASLGVRLAEATSGKKRREDNAKEINRFR
jgi:hypothetical protein